MLERMDELLKKIQNKGYQSYKEYCLKNWDKLTDDEKELLKIIGVKAPQSTGS